MMSRRYHIRERKSLCVVFRMATKRKHNKVTLKTKYEALKELDKNNKEEQRSEQTSCHSV